MAAAKQSVELLERLPEYVKDADLRRFNRILKDLDKLGKKHNYLPIPVESSSSLELFQTSEDAPWGLVSQRKLIKEERPDPAFTVISIDARGTWLLDRQGASIDLPGVKSVLRRVDREGALVSEKALNHDAYRTGISGCALAILDSGGVLRIYDEKLNALVESNLGEDSRVIEHFRSTDTNYWGELKSQVRAVDAASEGDRYLFTLADEVWCCTASGKTIWGLVMPLKEGWKRVVERSHRSGLAQDVEDSLELLGLSLPVAPVDIKKQYRKLVLAHHPDRNSGDPAATEKMKDLNAAFEILTGVDPNSLDYEESGVTHFTKTAPDYVLELEGARLEICITGEVPQDWVYAASFAGVDGGAYLATYSGKIARVSPEGQPEVVYDIGVCPKEIVEVGQYTYFLTATRLYVIEKTDTLVACVDVFQQGRLLVTQTGFGLLAAKQLRWFTHTGTRVGELTTKDPIRAIYATDDGTVFQTRQHQVEVQGLIM
ncbi:J domain-containing protein [Aliagarivorans taiwanensis]|uniref:J domain-containing protein n=1 Tax=Aliagarivorans taiwanensis TaxID=561966 RepID=UPI00146FAF67|nr:J domain-containing protein [Aliagarivorans taiwanensis]